MYAVFMEQFWPTLVSLKPILFLNLQYDNIQSSKSSNKLARLGEHCWEMLCVSVNLINSCLTLKSPDDMLPEVRKPMSPKSSCMWYGSQISIMRLTAGFGRPIHRQYCQWKYSNPDSRWEVQRDSLQCSEKSWSSFEQWAPLSVASHPADHTFAPNNLASPEWFKYIGLRCLHVLAIYKSGRKILCH